MNTKVMMDTENATRLTKERLRSRILSRLQRQKEEEGSHKSALIKEKLFRNKVFKKAKKVMFYISCGGEVDTGEMIKKAQKLGKIIAVPVCRNKRMLKPSLFRANAKLVKGPYRVYEPAIRKFIDLEDLDAVIVPGLAFDKKGMRLGRGKGYYDNFLRMLPKDTPSIGLAFDFQILPFVPATTTDVSVKRVISA
jgi:5-formyltetrahydrofolate cyclo-ligase